LFSFENYLHSNTDTGTIFVMQHSQTSFKGTVVSLVMFPSFTMVPAQ